MVALLGEVSVAASDAGRSSAAFLQIGQGARAAGLGGAYTAISEGAIAAWWNPAGLSHLEQSEISMGHFAWLQDIKVEQASFAVPVGRRLVVAASITYVNYGTIEGYDASGLSTGELTAYDMAGGLSLGYPINEALSIGLTGKYVNQRLDTYRASTFAADLGVKYSFEQVSLAATLTNLGGDLLFYRERESLPRTLRFGVAYRPFADAMVTSLELEQGFDGDMLIRQGVELGFAGQYYLRTGYDYLPSQDGQSMTSGLAVGAGVAFSFGRFDYAYSPNYHSVSEDLHRFTVAFKLGR
jgi:hypothetical protein